MKKAAEGSAKARAEQTIAAALARMEAEVGGELRRLVALRRVNPSVREADIAALGTRLTALREALPRSRVRLDAVRLAVSPDFLKLHAG
jgi:ATP-dependent helicase HepA